MKFGMIGLGKMGGNLARNMRDKGISVVIYNHTRDKVSEMITEGFEGAYSLTELSEKIGPDGVYWMMIPAGPTIDQMIEKIIAVAKPNALIIDGGNSNYKDTLRRWEWVHEKGYRYMDIGTSGGQMGARYGACMMVGGQKADYEWIESALKAICVPGGVDYMGENGSGHYVKMIHNGIEYGMMQAYAEGFEIMQKKTELELDLHQISEVWRFGSVVRSWLLDLAANALADDDQLTDIKGWVADSGEGRWTVAEAIDLDVPAPVITLSLQMRFVSRQQESYAAKMLAALRNQFGGHAVKREGE